MFHSLSLMLLVQSGKCPGVWGRSPQEPHEYTETGELQMGVTSTGYGAGVCRSGIPISAILGQPPCLPGCVGSLDFSGWQRQAQLGDGGLTVRKTIHGNKSSSRWFAVAVEGRPILAFRRGMSVLLPGQP